MQVKGLAKLDKKLQTFEKKTAKKIVRRAVRVGQKITLAAARSNAKAMVGGDMGNQIASALKVKAIHRQKKGSYQLQVAIDPAKADEFAHETEDGTRYFIPTAIEYGHRKAGGGTVPAIPFMLQAHNETEQQRIDALISEIKKGIKAAK